MHSSLWWLLTWLLPLSGAPAAAPISGPGGSASSLCLASAPPQPVAAAAPALALSLHHQPLAGYLGHPLLLPPVFSSRRCAPSPTTSASIPYHPPRLQWAEQLRSPEDLPVPLPLQVFPGNPGPSIPGHPLVEVLAEAEGTDDGTGLAGSPGQRGYRDAVVTTGWFGLSG